MIRIVIADDHKIFRDGISSILEATKGYQVIGQAANGKEALTLLQDNPVDVILLDISMPEMNGIEASKLIAKNFPSTRILILSMHDDPKYIVTLLESGANGYILKDVGKEELLNAISTVHSGNNYYSNQIAVKIVMELSSKKKTRKITGENTPLTNREKDVLRLITLEYTNSEIAEQLFISNRTVDTHRRNLLEKLELRNTAGLVKYAIRNGYID